MRPILIIFLLTNILFSEPQVVAAINKVKGDVKIRPGTSRKYESAYKGQMIRDGDWVKTDYGVFLGIVFLDGSKIKIHENTEIEIKSSRITAKELKTKMFLAEGETYGDISKQGKGTFQIETPTAVASIKGTELDVNFDFNEEITTLTVVDGLVEFGNELGMITAGAMEAAQATESQAAEVYEIQESDLPTWQDEEIEPIWGFILTPEKSGEQPINQSYKVDVQIINIESNENDNSFEGEINITTDNQLLKLSKDNNQWQSDINVIATNGLSTIYIKGISSGTFNLVSSSEDAESKSLNVNFFQSENQKSDLQEKFENIVSSKGYQSIVSSISDKSIKSTHVISGSIDANETLQKVDIGEYEIISVEEVQNSDGTISIKIKAQPSSGN